MTVLPNAPAPVASSTPKHTHSKTSTVGDNPIADVSMLYSPIQMLNNLISIFSFETFKIDYKLDKDANTEYIKFKGQHPGDSNLKLEMIIFSCYCDLERSDATPPF